MVLSRAAPLLLVALIAAGCGGAGESEPRDAPEPSGEAAEPAPVRTEPDPAPAPPPRDRESKAPLLDRRDAQSFDALQTRLGGEVGITVGTPGDADSEQLGSLRTGSAWSTIKVPIAAGVLEAAGGPKALSTAQQGLIGRAITASDNAAADALFASLGPDDEQAAAATGEVLREAGDATTRVSAKGRDGFSPYGQTEWSLEEQHRFMALLAAGDCLADPASSRYLLELMAQIVADQQWGLGSAGAGAARFKGGWGPGTDGRYLVRQMGVIEVDGEDVVVTLAVVAPDGQFATGTAAATELARWVARNVDPGEAQAVKC